MESQFDLRVLKLEDIPAADKLRQAAGWNQTSDDWRRLLALEPQGCFAAVAENRVVGTATTTSFGTDLAWIGMVLVEPTMRSRGIGRMLLDRCINFLQGRGVQRIKLDATPAGQILYEKLGFHIEWPLARWMRIETTQREKAFPNSVVPSAKQTDWSNILEFDREAFGFDRAILLQRLRDDSTQLVVSRDKHGQLAGFGFLRDGVIADYIGPVVARTEKAGKDITLHLLRASRRSVYWDIPGPCADATRWATQLGLVHQRPLARMYLGKSDAVGNPAHLWAISDPATG